jgi:hypothetical protein
MQRVQSEVRVVGQHLRTQGQELDSKWIIQGFQPVYTAQDMWCHLDMHRNRMKSCLAIINKLLACSNTGQSGVARRCNDLGENLVEKLANLREVFELGRYALVRLEPSFWCQSGDLSVCSSGTLWVWLVTYLPPVSKPLLAIDFFPTRDCLPVSIPRFGIYRPRRACGHGCYVAKNVFQSERRANSGGASI